ncbi:MAG: LicD family protein [Lachnospiraceae bacterium]|nr:LicD family protein [Lachnospiraceae bacterium]
MFSHRFYEEEIRCDYLIPSMVKRTWAAQLAILDDLDRAFSKCGLSYFAEWGTLLGAVRHAGFIPWDDDVDICMKRKDYMYLIDNVSHILPDNYSIVSYRSNRDFKQMLCRVVSSDHYRFDPEYMKKYSGLPFALGIDIFPLDFLSGDDEYEKDREDRVSLVYGVVNDMANLGMSASDFEQDIRLIEKKCRVSIDVKGDVLTQLRSLLEKLFGEVGEKDAKYITLYPLWMGNHAYKFPVEYYKEGLRLPFETVSVPVPACYDAVLGVNYGSSYMMPVKSGGAHEYPYYEMHVKVLKEHFGFEWPSYRFDKKDMTLRPQSDIERDTQSGGRALFITYSADAFKNMSGLVGKYIDDGWDVTILPAAKYDIAPDMTGIVPSADSVPDGYYTKDLEGACVTHDVSILDSHPDVIITNYPYDEYNMITAVDKVFYTKNLKRCCGKLVYVPAYEAQSVGPDDERAIKLMPSYVCTPMAAGCDEIVLHSSEMKERYVECLTAFSGGELRDVWEDKITVTGNCRGPASAYDPADGMTAKRRIMFYVGLGMFAQYGDRAVEKIKNVFGIFKENSDRIEVIYKTQEGLKENLASIYPGLYEKYSECDFGEGTKETCINDIDAYYGEASEYATQFLMEHKPVMILNCSV